MKEVLLDPEMTKKGSKWICNLNVNADSSVPVMTILGILCYTYHTCEKICMFTDKSAKENYLNTILISIN